MIHLIKDQRFNIDDFYTILKNFIKHKINYEKLVKEGGLSRELNLKYKKELSEYEELIKSSFETLKLRKNKYTVDNYTIELYMREIREPLTEETLGKYFYKFYYCTKILNDKDEEEKKKRNANYLTKLMLKFIENERYVGDKLSMRVTKNSKKVINDYGDFFIKEKRYNIKET